jgi:hypothetical protein
MRLHPGADRRCRTGSRERESYFHTIALLGVILHRRVVTGEPFEPSPGWPTVRPDPRLISSSPRRAKRPNAPKQSARRPLPADRERPSAGQWRAWSGQRAGAHVKTAAPRRNQHFAATHRGRARRSLGRVASSGLGFRHERTIRTRGPGGISIQAVRSGKVQGGWGMGGQTGNGRGAPVVGRNQRRSTPPVANVRLAVRVRFLSVRIGFGGTRLGLSSPASSPSAQLRAYRLVGSDSTRVTCSGRRYTT